MPSISNESIALITAGVAATLVGVAIAYQKPAPGFVAHAEAPSSIKLPELPKATLELPALPALPHMRRTPPMEDFLTDASYDISAAVDKVTKP